MPLNLAPAWIATSRPFNPVNWAVEAGRQALTDGPDWSFVLPRLAGWRVLTFSPRPGPRAPSAPTSARSERCDGAASFAVRRP